MPTVVSITTPNIYHAQQLLEEGPGRLTTALQNLVEMRVANPLFENFLQEEKKVSDIDFKVLPID